jgi:ABC-type multidrug transport system permease subunit
METQNNNNTLHENEVDNLRQQLAQFKQRLGQEEIISDRLMRHSMNARISIFTKSSVISDAIGLLSMPFILLAFYKVGISWYLGLIILLAVIVEFIYNVICHRKRQRLFTSDNDLLTVRRGLLKFKRAERVQMLIAVPFILLWVLVYYWQTGGLIASAVGIFFGLIICFGFYSSEMRRVNQSVREIDELAKD